ncbi:MAG TPA: CCA tRNA nucleotidyltransferase [Acetobacteraceae bacterium]|nr:CCA tRNA nucleotidyltransferase [Acetobacteraceae bacterium]
MLPEARVVGGAVRDALLARRVGDIDLATPSPPEAVTEALERAGLRALPTGLAHGTVTALAEGRSFEITALRSDVATDGRHAEVAFTRSWEADAARRDFTLNALSLTREGWVFDYFGGIADLIGGRVRFVGPPALRLAEDRLRTLRFFRFFAVYARAEPEAATLADLAAAGEHLGLLSAERVWSELKRLLAAPEPRPALALMRRLGVLAAVLPEAGTTAGLDRLAALGAPADPLLRLAALARGELGKLAERLKLSGAEAERLAELQKGTVPTADADIASLRRLLADEPAELLIARSLLAGIGGAAGGRLRARLATLPRPLFPLTGRDALALGMEPGPAVGAALGAVRAWWLAGGCAADAAACCAELSRRHNG